MAPEPSLESSSSVQRANSRHSRAFLSPSSTHVDGSDHGVADSNVIDRATLDSAGVDKRTQSITHKVSSRIIGNIFSDPGKEGEREDITTDKDIIDSPRPSVR